MAKSQTKASNKYNAKAYDRIAVQVYKGSREIIQAAASKAGESTNSYIIGAIDRRMKSEGLEGLPIKPAAPSAPESSGELSLPAEELNKDVSALPLGVRESNVIKRAGCNTIGELINYLSSDNCAIKKDGHFYRNIKAAVEGLHAETAPEDPNQIGE